MIKKILLVLGAGIFLAACSKQQGVVHGTTSDGKQIVQMAEKNGSKQMGSATIGPDNGKMRVLVSLNSPNGSITQPASIVLGTCDAPADVKFALADAKGGVSDTHLETDWNTIGGLAVAVFKSPDDPKTMVACGMIQ